MWKKKKLNQEVNQQSKVIITQNKNGVSTCMLLWAKKGQNAEWKLTSTFFHPNLCKPLIISSVNILKAIITLVMGQWTDNSKILNGGELLNATYGFTFHEFMVLCCIFHAGLVLCCLLCFGSFWRKMGAVRRNWGTIFNIYNVLVTIQRSHRGLSI